MEIIEAAIKASTTGPSLASFDKIKYKKEWDEAIKIAEANLDICSNHYVLGFYYFNINGEKSIKHLEIAIKGNHAGAMNTLARLYEIKSCKEKAFELYKRAAEIGFPTAISNLANCYY